MAKIFALIDAGNVIEVVRINDGEPSLSERYHAAIVENAVELKGPLAHTIQPGWKYDGAGFSQPAPVVTPDGPRYISVATVRERLEASGHWETLAAILQANPSIMLKVVTLRDGIEVGDPEARQLLAAAGADPDLILAP